MNKKEKAVDEIVLLCRGSIKCNGDGTKHGWQGK